MFQGQTGAQRRRPLVLDLVTPWLRGNGVFSGVSRGGTGLLLYLERSSEWPDLSTAGVLRVQNVAQNVDNWPAPGPGRPFSLMLTEC